MTGKEQEASDRNKVSGNKQVPEEKKQDEKAGLVRTMKKFLRVINRMTDFSKLSNRIYPAEYHVRMAISEPVGKSKFNILMNSDLEQIKCGISKSQHLSCEQYRPLVAHSILKHLSFEDLI